MQVCHRRSLRRGRSRCAAARAPFPVLLGFLTTAAVSVPSTEAYNGTANNEDVCLACYPQYLGA